jgi:ferrochelatase
VPAHPRSDNISSLSALCSVHNTNNHRRNRTYFLQTGTLIPVKAGGALFQSPAFINALVKNAAPYLEDIDKLVFSYHSLPVDQVEAAWKKGKEFDYVYQVKETNRLFCEKIKIPLQYTLLLYASQRGNNWLKPFLVTDIADLPRLGWKRVAVIAPGFPVDNLETLFDIDIQAREIFMKAGGEKFVFVPSLNYSDDWIEAIGKITLGV